MFFFQDQLSYAVMTEMVEHEIRLLTWALGMANESISRRSCR